jgi:hypothetical protein
MTPRLRAVSIHLRFCGQFHHATLFLFCDLVAIFFALKIVGSPQVTLTWPALSVTIYLHSALFCYLVDQKTHYAGTLHRSKTSVLHLFVIKYDFYQVHC